MQPSIWDFLTSNQLFVICGPCVIESHEHALMIGGEVANAAQSAGVNAIFKASFDKANRTSLDSYRGPGLEAGLQILADVREKTGLPVLTDIHETGQVEEAAAVCELLQIPAFLSRQTDLLLATGRSGRIVNVKKGQFMAPEDMRHVANKLISTGNNKIMLTERGSSFGYRDLLVEFPWIGPDEGTGLSGCYGCNTQPATTWFTRHFKWRTAAVHHALGTSGSSLWGEWPFC